MKPEEFGEPMPHKLMTSCNVRDAVERVQKVLRKMNPELTVLGVTKSKITLNEASTSKYINSIIIEV